MYLKTALLIYKMEALLGKLASSAINEKDGKPPVELTEDEKDLFTAYLGERCETLYQENLKLSNMLEKANSDIERLKALNIDLLKKLSMYGGND